MLDRPLVGDFGHASTLRRLCSLSFPLRVTLCLDYPPVGDFSHMSTLERCWTVHVWATLVMQPPLGDFVFGGAC